MSSDIGWTALAFIIGLAAGFQGIYEKYSNNTRGAVATLPAALYLLTRGAFPAALFFASIGQELLKMPLGVQALAVGAGSELFLRSSFYVRQAQVDGKTEALLKGPLDLLRWYQNLLLDAAGPGANRRRRRFLEENLPVGDFAALSNTILMNLGALNDPAQRTKVSVELQRLRQEFAGQTQTPELDAIYRRTFAYFILDLGEANFMALLGKS